MFPLPLLLNPLVVVLSLGTASGILLHDTNVDKATIAAISAPMLALDGASRSGFLGGDAHTHIHRISFDSVVRSQAARPRVQPKNGDDKKYLISKKTSKKTEGTEYHWPSV